jgi:hypothetical protein
MGNDGGPTTLEIQLSINGGSYSTVFTDDAVADQDSPEVNHGINLSAFDNVTSATFRLFGFTPENSNGQFYIQNFASIEGNRGIAVHGTLSAIPEPAAVLFGTLICGILGFTCGGKTYLGRLIRRAKA